MGIQENVGFDEFPIQSEWLGKRCRVSFRYNTERTIGGTVVRDDRQESGLMIIKLDDGRYVMATECHYTLPQ